MQTVGTCGNCGGPVQCPEFWGGSLPPPVKCARCGARPINAYGPVIPMAKNEDPPDPGAVALANRRKKEGFVS